MLESQPKRDAFEAAALTRSRVGHTVLAVDAAGDVQEGLEPYWTETSIVEPARTA